MRFTVPDEGVAQIGKKTHGSWRYASGAVRVRPSRFKQGVLGVVVMVMMVMVMPAGGENGACANQQQNRGDDELLHAMQSSTISVCVYDPKAASIKCANALNEDLRSTV
jgi:hypothetical protein